MGSSPAGDFSAAFGAELPAGGGRVTMWTGRWSRVQDILGICQFHFVGEAVQLSPGTLGSGGGPLLFKVWRAVLTESGSLVPAHFRADPFAAPGALMEMLTNFLDGCFKSFVMGFPANGSLHFISTVGGIMEKAAKEVASGPQEAASRACQ